MSLERSNESLELGSDWCGCCHGCVTSCSSNYSSAFVEALGASCDKDSWRSNQELLTLRNGVIQQRRRQKGTGNHRNLMEAANWH